MTAVRFFGPYGESSGYGNAVKNFSIAFYLSGIRTKFNFLNNRLGYIDNFQPYNGRTNIDFYLHCPPFTAHKSRAYKIAYFYWEADKLPSSWVRDLNYVDEIWAPCELVKKCCIRAGFKGDIKIVPTPIIEFDTEKKLKLPTSSCSREAFIFYSIFQWHSRKGYKELLKAYFSEFNRMDDVILILKVNPLYNTRESRRLIQREILDIKNYVGSVKSPKVFMSDEIISRDLIERLHGTADCYISPHHGEGWGMPIHDAMYSGKQIITTGYGGVTEYLDDSSAHLIDYKLGPVSDMGWSSLYEPSQRWAYPDEENLRAIMRDVYSNSDSYNYMSDNAKNIAKKMTVKAVANIVSKELKCGR